MKILIISDSHAKNEWIILKPHYDLIIHAGDHQMTRNWMLVNTDYYVDGNNDWGNQFQQVFTIDNLKFLLVHGDEQHVKSKNGVNDELLALAKEVAANIVIFGHTHMPLIETIDNITFINPGSVAKPKLLNGKKTYAELEIKAQAIQHLIIKDF